MRFRHLSALLERTRNFRRLLFVLGLLLIFIGAMGVGAQAGDPAGDMTGNVSTILDDSDLNPGNFGRVADSVGKHEVSLGFMWVLISGFLVIFMAAGFQLLETGFTRAKNAAHVTMKNLIAVPIAVAGFMFIGFALMFGGSGVGLGSEEGAAALDGIWSIGGWGIAGLKGWFLEGAAYDVGIMALFLFQAGFLLTATTIPSGAMAERMKLNAFAINALYVSMFLYPLFGMWVWGGGWLSQIGGEWGLGHGFVDFAGSGVVHAVGGFTALAGAIVLGPRIGKFNRDGSPNPLPGHHIPMAIFGTFVLFFGWFGFNSGSTLSGTDLRMAVVAANTLLAAAFGALAAMLYMWIRFKKPDPSMVANGLLAGLVGITAPCAFVQPWSASVIGAIAGLLVVEAVLFWEKRRVDDPVGAVAVHAINGIWGLLAVGLFANGTYGDGWNGVEGTVRGLFYGDVSQLAAQAVGAGAVIAWAFGVSFVWFKFLDKTIGIRAPAEDELAGLDIPELGVMAYPDFLEAKGEVFTSPEGAGLWVAPLPTPGNGDGKEPVAPTPTVSVVRNPESSKPGAPLYFFEVQTPGLHARLPVWRKGTPGDPYVKEIYSTELLGQSLERGNLQSLEAAVNQTLAGIIHGTEIPAFLFRAPDGLVIPVFRQGTTLWANVHERRLEGPDLAELRATVSEHLGIRAGLADGAEVQMMALGQEDLRGIAPVFTFAHRDLAVAVFARPWGALYTEIAGQEMEAGPGLEGVLALRREVALRLHDAGRLYDPADLRLEGVAQDTWSAWTAGTERSDELTLSWGDEVSSYRFGDSSFAAIPAPSGRLVVWFGRDRWDLTSRIDREARTSEGIARQ